MALWGWTEADWGYVNCERLWFGGGLRRRWHTWLGDIVQPRKTILQSGCSFETRTFRNEIALMAGSCRREWIGRKLTDRMQKWECVDRRLYRYPSELLCGRKDAFFTGPPALYVSPLLTRVGEVAAVSRRFGSCVWERDRIYNIEGRKGVLFVWTMLDQVHRLLVVVYVCFMCLLIGRGVGRMHLCNFCSCMIHLLREGKDKGKGHPRTGHEGPEGE